MKRIFKAAAVIMAASIFGFTGCNMAAGGDSDCENEANLSNSTAKSSGELKATDYYYYVDTAGGFLKFNSEGESPEAYVLSTNGNLKYTSNTYEYYTSSKDDEAYLKDFLDEADSREIAKENVVHVISTTSYKGCITLGNDDSEFESILETVKKMNKIGIDYFYMGSKNRFVLIDSEGIKSRVVKLDSIEYSFELSSDFDGHNVQIVGAVSGDYFKPYFYYDFTTNKYGRFNITQTEETIILAPNENETTFTAMTDADFGFDSLKEVSGAYNIVVKNDADLTVYTTFDDSKDFGYAKIYKTATGKYLCKCKIHY